MRISQSAFDLIVAEEVTSQAYYTKHYQHPEWPGGQSGVTIGIGYDLGYSTVEKITADWKTHVSPTMLAAMCLCAGVRGDKARMLLPSVKLQIVIPWEAALDVFADRDIPNYTAEVIHCIPQASALDPTCLGVLDSLAYNRGSSFGLPGDRYVEMRNIKRHIEDGKLALVSGELRAMKRLWPSVKGLRDRRDHEAALWDKGMSEPGAALAACPAAPLIPDYTIPMQPGPARTKPNATTPSQHGTAGIAMAAGAVAAQQAHAHGMISPGAAVFMGFLGVLAGVTAWVVWYRNRNPK